MKIDGACHCGYIRVEGDADPEKTTVCHCTDCQVGNGSAFRVNVPVPGATFRITGQPATYLKTTAESGNPRLQAFCPRCGCPESVAFASLQQSRPAFGPVARQPRQGCARHSLPKQNGYCRAVSAHTPRHHASVAAI